jgi:hypothetical protein
MQRLCRFSVAIAASVFLLLQSPGASGAESAKPPASNNCGVSSREAIASAEKALAEKSAESETRALVCLLAAVKALEVQRLDVVRGKDTAHLLSVPRGP